MRHRQAMIDEFDLDQDGEISIEVRNSFGTSPHSNILSMLIYCPFAHRNSLPS